jgi:hypothetical protein
MFYQPYRSTWGSKLTPLPRDLLQRRAGLWVFSVTGEGFSFLRPLTIFIGAQGHDC